MEKCICKRNRIKCFIEEIEKAVNDNHISEVGKEIQVTQNIFQVWEDYYFVLNGFLIRWDDCHEYIQQILKLINELCIEDGQLSAPVPLSNLLAYRFEDLLVAFPRLNEDALITEIERHINPKNKAEIRNNCYKRNDVHGLFWELNLLRNRAAHSINSYYTLHEGLAARYLSVSSKISIIDCNYGKKVFRSNLYSYRKNEFFSTIVQECIIEAKYGKEISEKPIMDILFENTTPKGHGRKNPVLLYPSKIEFFDLNSEFYELSNDMLDYVIKQLVVFNNEMSIENS